MRKTALSPGWVNDMYSKNLIYLWGKYGKGVIGQSLFDREVVMEQNGD